MKLITLGSERVNVSNNRSSALSTAGRGLLDANYNNDTLCHLSGCYVNTACQSNARYLLFPRGVYLAQQQAHVLVDRELDLRRIRHHKRVQDLHQRDHDRLHLPQTWSAQYVVRCKRAFNLYQHWTNIAACYQYWTNTNVSFNCLNIRE